MRVCPEKFGCRRLLVCAGMLLLQIQLTTLAQQRSPARGSVPPEHVKEMTERVRSPAADVSTLEQAFDLGTALLREGRFVEAADLFSALAEKRPTDSLVLYGAALAAFNCGRVAEAEPLARKAVERALAGSKTSTNAREVNDRAADALVLLAIVLGAKKDDGGALKSAEQAVRLAPASFDAQFVLGRALFGSGDRVGAVRAFRAAVAIKPSDGNALFFLATALERTGDDQNALVAYRELVAKQPGLAEGHLGLGALLIKRSGSEINEGMAQLALCLEINPNLYEARVTLGRVLVTRGRAADAIEHLRLAAELAPNNPEPHYQLSLAYRRLGRKEEAAAESAIVKRIHELRRSVVQPSAVSTPSN